MRRRQLLQQAPFFMLALGSSAFLKSCKEQEITPSAPRLTALNFGILTTESEADLAPIWEPFLAAMSVAVGLPVKAFFATQYSSLIESMRSGVVQIAWFGGKTYIEAAKLADARAFALTISDTGEKGYYSHLITHGDRPWLAQAKQQDKVQYLLEKGQDLSFAFNDLNSTSGYLVPIYYLFAKNSIDPLQHFEKVIFLGNHEATALDVAEQKIDLATNNSEALQRFQEKFPDKYQDLQIVWTSPLIPADPIAYDDKLPEAIKQKIRDFFYNYKDQTVLNALHWSGFEQASDADWHPIRELKLGKQMLEIQQNTAIGETEKQNILEGLQQQLDQLPLSAMPE